MSMLDTNAKQATETQGFDFQSNACRSAHMASLALSQALGLPFDMAREQYARAVQAGLLEKSIITSARFEQVLSATETLAYGPWARSR